MKKRLGLLFSLPLLFGLAVEPVSVSAAVGDYHPDPVTYYSGIGDSGGISLLGELHDLLVSTHETYTSYDDCKNPTYIVETDSDFAGNVLEFYSQTTIAKSWGEGKQGTWNREHVWCQSLSNGLWGESYGGSDLHHIRPVESGLNSARNNAKYGEVEHTSANEKYYEDATNQPVALGGYARGQEVFEPIDDSKGDVARIIFYVYTHYNSYEYVGGTTNGDNRQVKFGKLDFSDVIDGSEEEAIGLLLSWHELDPVSEYEMARTEAVAQYQGNRNPFIDHPEYAERIWGAEVEPSVQAPASFSLTIGESKQLGAKVYGGDAVLEYISSDESIASVSSTGVVTGLGVGEAVITSLARIEGREYSASTKISVNPASIEGRYRKLVAIPENIDGKYIIAYGNLALDSSLIGDEMDKAFNTVEIELEGDYVIGDTANCELEFKARGEGFDIITPGGYRIYATSNNDNTLKCSLAQPSATNKFSTEYGGVGIVSSAGAVLRFNSASNQMRFRYYNTQGGKDPGQQPITIYKLSEDENVASAKSFAASFLSSIQCDNGVTPPSVSAWEEMAAQAEGLSLASLSILQSADYQDGAIGLAVERYDYIIRKYGTAQYPDFLNRGIEGIYGSRTVDPFASAPGLFLTAFAITLIGAIVLCVALRRKLG